MATTENYRISAILSAYEAALGRIAFTAKNGGSLKEIARDAEATLGFASAVNTADTAGEITELVAQRN